MLEPEDTPKTHVLCYGDSNTWGYVPAGGGARHPNHVRWPGVLSKLLRTSYRITEEGLCGRTTVFDDPFSPGVERNGLKLIGAILDSHKPLDLVIIFLGTNDLKNWYSATAHDIAKGAETLAQAARNPQFGPGGATPPDILIICPLTIWEVATAFGPQFRGGRDKSQDFRDAFRSMAERMGAPLLYAEDFIASDPLDGIHLSADSHGILGQEVAKWILEWADARRKPAADN